MTLHLNLTPHSTEPLLHLLFKLQPKSTGKQDGVCMHMYPGRGSLRFLRLIVLLDEILCQWNHLFLGPGLAVGSRGSLLLGPEMGTLAMAGAAPCVLELQRNHYQDHACNASMHARTFTAWLCSLSLSSDPSSTFCRGMCCVIPVVLH